MIIIWWLIFNDYHLMMIMIIHDLRDDDDDIDTMVLSIKRDIWNNWRLSTLKRWWVSCFWAIMATISKCFFSSGMFWLVLVEFLWFSPTSSSATSLYWKVPYWCNHEIYSARRSAQPLPCLICIPWYNACLLYYASCVCSSTNLESQIQCILCMHSLKSGNLGIYIVLPSFFRNSEKILNS